MQRHVALRQALGVLGIVFLMGILALSVLWSKGGHANGLRVNDRVYRELNTPLVPVTRNFRTCFKTGSDGIPVMGLCASESSKRTPAATKKKKKKKKKKTKKKKRRKKGRKK